MLWSPLGSGPDSFHSSLEPVGSGFTWGYGIWYVYHLPRERAWTWCKDRGRWWSLTFSSSLHPLQIPLKLTGHFPSHPGSSLPYSLWRRMWKIATFMTFKKNPLSPPLYVWPAQGSCSKFFLLPLQPLLSLHRTLSIPNLALVSSLP